MASTKVSNGTTEDAESVRADWIGRLTDLIDRVQSWARELGWSTRRIEKKMDDSLLGSYPVPALIMQEDTVRVLLEPIARSAPGADGVVDLYLMPGYDDIATLYLCDNGWQLHYMFPHEPTVSNIRDASPKPLTQELFREVLDEMRRNAA